MARLADLLAAYPWLRRLQVDVLSQLDVDELADPHPSALALGRSVVAYRRGVRPSPGRLSLCALIPAAKITPERITALADAERAHPQIVVVEYAPAEGVAHEEQSVALR